MTEHRRCVTSQKRRNAVQVVTNELVFRNHQCRDTHKVCFTGWLRHRPWHSKATNVTPAKDQDQPGEQEAEEGQEEEEGGGWGVGG